MFCRAGLAFQFPPSKVCFVAFYYDSPHTVTQNNVLVLGCNFYDIPRYILSARKEHAFTLYNMSMHSSDDLQACYFMAYMFTQNVM